MAKRSTPGELEQVVLWTIASFTEEATGGDIYAALVDSTGRELSLAAVYITLARLEDKGWVAVRTEPPAAGQGGKPRKFFRLTDEGASILVGVREQSERLWKRAAGHPALAAGRDRDR
jgi:DNA-binding PadR family transcriptional regulator